MHIHADDDMSLMEFKTFCRNAWNEAKHNFVTIDLTNGRLNGKYRNKLDCFYLPGVPGAIDSGCNKTES